PKLSIKGHASEKASDNPFSTAKHFLNQFELILNTANANVEQSWEHWLTCAIDYDQRAWFDDTIAKKGLSWKAAQQKIIKAYDNIEPRIYSGLNLLKMKMHPSETVQDFRLRFQKACTDARWTDDYKTAQVCLNVLPQRIKDAILSNFYSWNAQNKDTDIATAVPKSAEHVLNMATRVQILPHHMQQPRSDTNIGFKRPYEDNDSSKRYRQKPKCILHPNAQHSTNECEALKRAQGNSVQTRPCRYCKAPFIRPHTCNPKTDPVVQSIQQQVPNDDYEYQDLREISEGKTQHNTKRKISTEHNLLYVPIIIQNERTRALIDTGADTSIISLSFIHNNKIQHTPSKGILHLAGQDNTVPRIGTTTPLTIRY
ncbi:hypothetical protein, partial, partial [Absidia glauca]